MERIVYLCDNETIEIITEYPTFINLKPELSNGIWCDTGDTKVKFLLTVGKKIA